MILIKASCLPQRKFVSTQNIAHRTVVTGPDLAEFCRGHGVPYGDPTPDANRKSLLTQGGKEGVDGTFAEPVLASLSLISAVPRARQNHGSPSVPAQACTLARADARTPRAHTPPTSYTWDHRLLETTLGFRCNHPSLESDSFIVQ